MRVLRIARINKVMEHSETEKILLVSIVVPAYNAETTIRRCLDSLVKQTYPYCEVIVVNDGSTDGTRMICESYSETYSCVKLINKQNGGQSSARNAGLEVAIGDYIMFCDSDDFVSCQIVEKLMDSALSTCSDIVECPYVLCIEGFEGGKKTIGSTVENEFTTSISGNAAVVNFVLDYGLVTVAPWGKLYSAHLFESKRFPTELSRYEDDALMPYLAESATKYSRINQPLYAYCVRENSVMTSPYSKSDLQLMRVFEDRAAYFGVKYGEESATLIKYRYLLAMNEFVAAHGKQMDFFDRKAVNNKRRDLFKLIGTFPGMKRKVLAVFTTLLPRTSHVFRKIKKSRKFSIESVRFEFGLKEGVNYGAK